MTAQSAAGMTRFQKLKRSFKRDCALHIMLLLPLIILILYKYVPMFGIVIAFQKYKPALGFADSDWIGFENFTKLFATSGFSIALKNTVIIAVSKIILGIVVPVSFSLLLNEMNNRGVKRMIQSIIYLPHFVSWVIMASIVGQILSPSNGFINQILKSLTGNTIFFMGSNDWFRPVILVSHVWKEFGYSTIVYLAALSGIDPALLESAEIDGAGYWKRMLNVTLPTITPTIILMGTLALGNVLNAGFDQVYNLLNSSVMESGDILDTLVYRLGIGQSNYSMSTTASLFKSVISAILIVTSYRLAYKFSGYRLF